jgi:Uncharacterised 5xTM membrane BCR, YitT family COG1284
MVPPPTAPTVPTQGLQFATTARSTLLVVLGIFSAGMGIKGFLLSSHFIDGGVTGISMLLTQLTHWPIAVLMLALNLPFLALGYRRIGRSFAIKSAFAMAGLALCLWLVPFPDVTPDVLLTAVFGGMFIGAGIGLAMRGGAVLDGTEILALLVSSRSPAVKVSDVILILNVGIFSAALFVLGVEPALLFNFNVRRCVKVARFYRQWYRRIYWRHHRLGKQRRDSQHDHHRTRPRRHHVQRCPRLRHAWRVRSRNRYRIHGGDALGTGRAARCGHAHRRASVLGATQHQRRDGWHA